MADGKIGSYRGRGNGYVPESAPDPKKELKKKQKQSIVDTFNQPDPVGDFVRRITGANREKKKSGY